MARSVVDAEILEQLILHLAKAQPIGKTNPHAVLAPLSDEDRISPPLHIHEASEQISFARLQKLIASHGSGRPW